MISKAASTRRLLGSTSRASLGWVLHDVAAQWRGYRSERAYTLFSMLEFNAGYLAEWPLPAAGSEVRDGSGVVYQAYAGHGLQFQPLRNFSRLNALIRSGRDLPAQILASALLDRGIPRGRGLVWEYYFPYGGPQRWTSGMVQAVAARALARLGLVDEARQAFLGLPSLLRQLSGGPWVRLYSFSPTAVLNAQLQAVLSLELYADDSGDADAIALAKRMLASTNALFPRFDTGAWSLYSLGGPEAPLSYHRYVILLLKRLADETGGPVWAARGRRFDHYRFQRPAVSIRVPTGPVVGTARITVRVSKLSSVTLRVGDWETAATLSYGSHAFYWSAAGRPPGRYAVRVTARDVTGNEASVAGRPVVVGGRASRQSAALRLSR